MRVPITVAVLVAGASLLSAFAPQSNPYLGRWNMTGVAPDTGYVYWLEIKQEGDQLKGLFLNRGGHAIPLALVKIENGELVFQGFAGGRGTPPGPGGPEYRAKVENGKLIGHHSITVNPPGGRGRNADPNAPPPSPPPPPTTRVVNWVGVRPPTWPASNANGSHTYGKPVVLFDGSSLDAWTFAPATANPWSIQDGMMTNAYPKTPAANLMSKEKFGNFKIEAEYKLEEKSNSGIYLRGRYELQVLDDINDTTTEPFLTHMAIYGRTAPRVKASKPAGEWQAMEAVIVGNRVTVMLNGQRLHDNAVIEGITGGALDADELSPGPILIQGDHSKVWFRKVIVTPITSAGK
jgi:3-keto-disaccharide hydrolase